MKSARRALEWTTLLGASSAMLLLICHHVVTLGQSHSPAGLPVSNSQVCVKLLNGSSDDASLQFANDYGYIDAGEAPSALGVGFYIYRVNGSFPVAEVIDSLRANREVAVANPVYIGSDGSNVYATDRIIVKFRQEASGRERDSLNALFASVADIPDYDRPRHQYLTIRHGTGQNAADVCALYMESGLCEWAKPNFVWTPILNTIPLWDKQWHFRNNGTDTAGIDADSAWYLSKGSAGIKVAVIDLGFPWDAANSRVAHEDLNASNPVSGYDVVGRTWYPPDNAPDNNPFWPCYSPSQADCKCSHGIEVLGLLAADQSVNAGLRGLAPNCTYRAIKALADLDGQTTDSLFAAAFHYAWTTFGAHVVSTSLGYPLYGGDSTIWYDELADMAQNGIIVTVAGGNHGWVEPPADAQGVFAVGATDMWDERWFYSAVGGRLDFVAPAGGTTDTIPDWDCIDTMSEFWTLDIMGDSGFVPSMSGGACGSVTSHYMCRGTGTSVAAPQVAGVAALILSRRPDIVASGDPRTIVFDILKNTAEDLGTPLKDDEYGYGRINAFRAMCAVSRGDCNWDGIYNMPDLVAVLNEAVRGGSPPALFHGLSDINCDGIKNIQDYLRLQDYIFDGGTPPDVCYKFNY